MNLLISRGKCVSIYTYFVTYIYIYEHTKLALKNARQGSKYPRWMQAAAHMQEAAVFMYQDHWSLQLALRYHMQHPIPRAKSTRIRGVFLCRGEEQQLRRALPRVDLWPMIPQSVHSLDKWNQGREVLWLNKTHENMLAYSYTSGYGIIPLC